GAIQTGNSSFKTAQPAQLPLAGDQTGNGTAPTYASLTNLASLHNDRRVTQASGQPANVWLDKEGHTGVNPSLGAGVTLQGYDSVTGHNLASVFSSWLAAQPWDSLQVMGRPISEPYWILTKLGGKSTWVLVQAFERRVLTYTPSNPAAWQVEMGNAGLAYYQWRYGKVPSGG
ncbi:MAG TPA: CAP domain-containing protein, partial [Thermomicrobiaceae bacterium]|nr:CAP domain-containing protein [Thermomicrobiaceae bacterium]